MSKPTENLLADFWSYCSCYEITRGNATWALLGGLAGVVNRKIYTRIGDIPIYCNLYVLLVGSPGTGKSTAMDFTQNLVRAACPEYPIGPSKQSHGDIIKFMSSDECATFFTNSKGEKEETRVYNFFIDEFKNFVAYDILGMLNFLTGIYSAKDCFNVSTLIRGREDIPNPSLSFVAGENPSWMIRHIKNDTISDGLGRRVIIVYETIDAPPRPEVIITPEIHAQAKRMVELLRHIKTLTGEYTFSPDGRAFYNQWYVTKDAQMRQEHEQIFRGYLRTKHIQLLKICMLVDAATGKPQWKFTEDLLQTGLALLNEIEPNIPRLFISAGRNELAAPQQKILDLLEANNGIMSERDVERLSGKDLNPGEQMAVLGYLKRTEQIYRVQLKVGNIERWCYMSPTAFARERSNIKK